MGNSMPLKYGIVVTVVALQLVLGGCEVSSPSRAKMEVSFTHLPRIALNVAHIEIANRVQMTAAKKTNYRGLETLPLRIMRRWARDRLRAGGRIGTAKFVIIDASLVGRPLAGPKGLRSLFTQSQKTQHNISMEARIEISRKEAEGSIGFAHASVRILRTVPEGITLNEQEDLLYKSLAKASDNFNSEIEAQISEHLTKFLL